VLKYKQIVDLGTGIHKPSRVNTGDNQIKSEHVKMVFPGTNETIGFAS